VEEKKKIYWKGLEQLKNDPEYIKYADKEFPEYLPIQGEENGETSSRRDFLKLMGFSVAAVSLASCEAPIRKAIPYVNKPMDVDPGVPNYYASTMMQNGQYASVVVKTREGRPIKIEGNTLSKITQGSVNTQVEASVLSLYDKERLQGPLNNGKATQWADLDQEIMAGLEKASSEGKKIALVSHTVISPSAKKVLGEFQAKFPGTEHIVYDTQSVAGLLKANKAVFGVSLLPSFHFEKARIIVSLGADFLGTWIDPIEFTKGYSKNRKIGGKVKSMSRHYQYESNLSLTGANADYRIPVKPSEEGKVALSLYNAVAKLTGGDAVEGGADYEHINKAASELVSSKGASLVVSGSNDPAIQQVVAATNHLLNNYGSTITFEDYSNIRQGDDTAMDAFVSNVGKGEYGAVLFLDTNPVYNHPKGKELEENLAKVPLTVSTADRKDETASIVSYVAPTTHFLESWNDAEPKNGSFSFTQPTISNLFDTRQQEESLLRWVGNNDTYFDYIKRHWQEMHGEGKTGLTYQSFWDKCLQDGVYETEAETPKLTEPTFDLTGAAVLIKQNYRGDGFELVLHQKVAIGDGSQANNPWLQETPDPITKATWDNYLTISMADAKAYNIVEEEGKVNRVNIIVGTLKLNLPVIIQPGQAQGTAGIALGYGRKSAGNVANDLGVDATSLIGNLNGTHYLAVTSGVELDVLNDKYQIARTQTHQTFMERDNIIQESVLSEYKKHPDAGRVYPKIGNWMSEEGEVAPGTVTLWKGHKYPDHHWGMVVDLNSCTGCSACHVACQSENNIPVVGRQEVINRREMHWMRIDRYYSTSATKQQIEDRDYDAMMVASDNPEVTFQPMMCQHCNNAGCETVCPVAATTHSTSGLNQMVYNRCIGTRYCANNCPYKVRRFNWFKYHDNEQFDKNSAMNNDLGKMVLNPDVTVRSRGVMEKCSMCVQRIQLGKLQAKKEDRRTNDGDINTACAAACPADAILFGDMNDPNSAISKRLKIKNTEGDYGIDRKVREPRAYAVLEEVGSKPNVLYLTKIRNKEIKKSNA